MPREPTPLEHGFTPNELARLLRVSPDRIRAWIKRGELSAIDTAPPRSGRPRYIVLPAHLEAFEQQHRAMTTATKHTPRRSRRAGQIDFYPD